MNYNFKTMSGSSRDKTEATPKQNKWNNPFYSEARGLSKGIMLTSHKIDSIRDHVSGVFHIDEPKGFFKMIGAAITGFFGFNSRKGLA